MYTKSIYTKIGKLNIKASDVGVCEVSFNEEVLETNENIWTIQCEMQLKEYFNKKREVFTIPLDIKGTAFQKQVWDALCKIPYGKTCSYKDIALMIQNPKAVRAIGNANHKNPIAIIIPCHRVIAYDKSIGGYAFGIDIKKYLLDLECGEYIR